MGASEIERRIQQALKALRAGRKEEARSILLSVVDEQEDNERAWLYLSAAVDTLEEQQICLENVLAINPAHEKARQGLERINRARAARRPAPSSPPASSPPPFVTMDTPTPPPRSKGPFGDEVAIEQGASGAWFAAGPFVEEPPLPPERDPYAPATSVDWVRDDAPAVYGSGQQVELPSEQEYDEWLRNLKLGSSAKRESGPEIAPSVATPDHTPPFAGEPPLPAAPFIEAEGAQRGRRSAGEEVSSAQHAPSLEESLRSTIVFEEEGEAEDDGPSWPPFWRATPDEVIEPSSEEEQELSAPAEQVGLAGALKGAPAAVDSGSYYAYIPDDIEAAPEGLGWRAVGYLLGIIILIALNALSFGYLLR